ncbi:MAG: hypothetical protein E6G50_08450 [Actinobacteria bacterium]|nr:MAG: hypothetical protein E6G50_08450 [Actinomycetota bacterium]
MQIQDLEEDRCFFGFVDEIADGARLWTLVFRRPPEFILDLAAPRDVVFHSLAQLSAVTPP